MKTAYSMLFAAMIACAAAGCVVQPDDAGRFREAVPTPDDVKLKEPTGGEAAASPQAFPGADLQDNGPASYAKYYKFTRDIFDGVNFGTGYILGSVWLLIQLPPTTLSGTEAIWGPGSEALSPAEWRFRATELADGEIEYFFEGRSKQSSSDQQWLPILHGKGYAKNHAKHRNGWFDLDYDNANKLDPARLHGDHESGKTRVEYALTSYPINIRCKLEPAAPGVAFDIITQTQASGGGLVDIQGTDDLDASKTTKLENIRMHSRWVGAGAGRADVTISGGDVPADIVVHASECWSSTFERTYYSDTINAEPASGQESACAFATAQYE